jgi:hypothetical protein
MANDIKEFIKKKMVEELISVLTIGRTDNDLEPFTELEINNFMTDKDKIINEAVDDFYKVTEDDGELDEIYNSCDSDFREILYEHIDTTEYLE